MDEEALHSNVIREKKQPVVEPRQQKGRNRKKVITSKAIPEEEEVKTENVR